MRKKMKGLLLGAAVAGMTVASALTAMAAETVNVTVPNVRGGYLDVYFWDENYDNVTRLPIGETSAIPKGTELYVTAEALDYQPSDTVRYESFIYSVTANGEEIAGEYHGNDWAHVMRGEAITDDLVLDAVFKGNEKAIIVDSGSDNSDNIDLLFVSQDERTSYISMPNAGAMQPQQLYLYNWNTEKEIPFTDISEFEFRYVDYQDFDSEYTEVDELFELSDTGVLTATQNLELGTYNIALKYEYEEEERNSYLEIYVGARVDVEFPSYLYKNKYNRTYHTLYTSNWLVVPVKDATKDTYNDIFNYYKISNQLMNLSGYEAIGVGYYNNRKATWTPLTTEKVKDNLSNTLSDWVYIIFEDFTPPTIEPLIAADIMDAEVKQGWNEIGGEWYYFETTDPNSMLKNEWITEGDKTFYVGADGAMLVEEIAEIDGNKYYFDTKGRLAKNKKLLINDVKYQADENGVLTLIVDQGWNEIDGKWYFYKTTSPDSLAKDEWIADSNGEFYVGEDGALVTNSVVEFEGNEYVVDKDGKKVVDDTIVMDGVEYETDEEGILVDKSVVLATPSNATEAVKQTETVLENLDIMNKEEKIEAADMLTEALLKNNNTSKLTAEEVAKFEELYYAAYGEDNIAVDPGDVNKVTGIVAAAGLKSDDFAEDQAEIEFATEWLGTSSNAQERLDVKLLVNGEEKDALAAPIEFEIDLPEEFIASYSNATIKVENVDDFEVDMEAGTIRVKISKLGLIRIVATIETPKDDNNDDDDHQSSKPAKSKKKATVTVKKETEDGSWIQDAKGWWFKKTDGTWASNGWAYLTWNGQDSWYYFDAEGYLVTGWVLYNGNWYYMHPIADGTQGHLYTGWNLIDGQWFYMNPEKGATQGAVLTGWNLINNIWYYFSEVKDSTEGMMLSNTTTPDGYKVGADGAWIQ